MSSNHYGPTIKQIHSFWHIELQRQRQKRKKTDDDDEDDDEKENNKECNKHITANIHDNN